MKRNGMHRTWVMEDGLGVGVDPTNLTTSKGVIFI